MSDFMNGPATCGLGSAGLPNLVSVIGYRRVYTTLTRDHVSSMVELFPDYLDRGIFFTVIRRTLLLWLVTKCLGGCLGNMALTKDCDLALCVESARRLRDADDLDALVGCAVADFTPRGLVLSQEFGLAMIIEVFRGPSPWTVPGLVRNGKPSRLLRHSFERYRKIFTASYRTAFYSKCFSVRDIQGDASVALKTVLSLLLDPDAQLSAWLISGKSALVRRRAPEETCAAAVACELLASQATADVIGSLTNGVSCFAEYHSKELMKRAHVKV